MAGLVPAISLGDALCPPKRDAGHKAGHDGARFGARAKRPGSNLAGFLVFDARRGYTAAGSRLQHPWRHAACGKPSKSKLKHKTEVQKGLVMATVKEIKATAR